MAHGKETPRQKMIGMMYLVLTAMLALNVSAEVLDAFVLVDSGLSQTTRNYAAKNDVAYSTFEAAAIDNPAKVAPWKEKADQVRLFSQKLVAHLQRLKQELVIQSDGPTSQALAEGDINVSYLNDKQNTEVSSRVLVVEGRARILKDSLALYRDLILSYLDQEKDKGLYEQLASMLNTEDPPVAADGTVRTWESYRFENIPLVAAFPQLTKTQVDVLNAEADIVNYLLQRIDAGSFKFNRIEPVVIPSSDYVMRGSEFKAEIFLAASDTTSKPRILLGAYDSVFNEKSREWSYNMKGPFDSIPIQPNGRGLLRRTPTSLGTVRWGGLIEIPSPDGGVTRRPFKHAYTVGEPSFAVSPTKMNVFYEGLDNPVDISVSGYTMDQITPSITGGTLRKAGNSYVVRPTRAGTKCVISLSVTEPGGRRKVIGSKEFRAKRVPDPIPAVFNTPIAADGSVQKARLAAAQGIEARMDNFDFDLKYQILGFTVGVTQGGFLVEKSSNSPRFTAEQRALINTLASKQQLNITNIRVKGPDGRERKLQTAIVLKVQ